MHHFNKEDLNRVCDMIYFAPEGSVWEIEQIPFKSEDRKGIFIECVKYYIDTFKDAVFNDDYTKFKKIKKFNKEQNTFNKK